MQCGHVVIVLCESFRSLLSQLKKWTAGQPCIRLSFSGHVVLYHICLVNWLLVCSDTWKECTRHVNIENRQNIELVNLCILLEPLQFIEADSRCFQVEVERIRGHAHGKLMNKLAAARHKAQEKRAAAEAKRNQQAAKAEHQAEYIRKTGHIPSSFWCWGWCYWYWNHFLQMYVHANVKTYTLDLAQVYKSQQVLKCKYHQHEKGNVVTLLNLFVLWVNYNLHYQVWIAPEKGNIGLSHFVFDEFGFRLRKK